jgi:hypothetical protein
METRITRKSIKIHLKRPLSAQEIWNRIMDIQIQALESLLEDKSLDKWKIIFPCYGTSLEAVESMAREYIAAFQRVQGDTFNNRYEDIEDMLMNGLNNRWLNTLMSTLYMMEEDLMEMSSDSVFTLWDIFFTCQALRKENNVVAMGLNTFELKRQ